MGDLIERQSLLDALSTWDKFGCDADTKLVPYKDHYIPYIRYDDVVKSINGLPPSVSTEKTGYWVYKTIRGEKVPCCSRCGLDSGTGYEFDFCPSCGAKMIEPQESEDKK